jgi:hypothetical protein
MDAAPDQRSPACRWRGGEGIRAFVKMKNVETGARAVNAYARFGPTIDDVAEWFAVMPDDAVVKVATALEIFGRRGPELIPLLNLGGEALREMRRQFWSGMRDQ